MPDVSRILIADDDAEDQEMIVEAIRQFHPGALIRLSPNGLVAVNYLENCTPENLPGLIILDYKMPILSGVDVLKHLSANNTLCSIPVMIWSSSKQDEHVRLCMENGATEYFVKPNSQAELDMVAKKMLSFYREI